MPRFNHMELTLPKGELEARRGEIAEFYREIFGFDSIDVPILGQNGLLIRTDPETSQFILVTEQNKHLQSPGFDHLGFYYDTRAQRSTSCSRPARSGRRRTSASRSRSTRIS